MSDSIQVAIKVRPLIKREQDENLQEQWTVADKVIAPADPEKKRGDCSFQFDHIFDPQKTNSDVFETVVRPIVDAAVKGFNGTVFAYGQTSSGKTHTMLGTPDEPGVTPMAVERMFDAITETCGREFLLRVSYLEIYNEKVNDLLDTTGMDLKLREDSNGLVQVLKSKEEIASNPDLIMSIMKKGDKNRRIGETNMNERSSRSHTIFRITIESREQSSDSDGAIQVSQLNLVDLAGSERANQTNATGERFKEGTHINMSLSTLGLVIKQLSESSDNTKYVNFRDSKLTRLLQASLGGNAMTAIICAVTPAAFEETMCTLGFASRAKSVKNKPQLNEVMSDAALLKRYKKQLAKLNEELEKLKHEKGFAEVQEIESRLQEKEHKLQEKDRLNQMLEERIELLKNAIVSTGSSTRDNNLKNSTTKRRRTWAGSREIDSRPRLSLCFNNLPTISETSVKKTSSSNENICKINRRKSIIQTVNLNEESFETAFTDFELELIKVAKERELTDSTDFTEKKILKLRPKTENRVKFEDDVEIYRFSNGNNWSNSSTPEKNGSKSNNDQSQESSPGTPKSVLRERLHYLSKEFDELQNFTTLEKQMLQSEKYQKELEEILTLSVNCINELSLRTPDILELWKPSSDSEEKEESHSNAINDLNQLLDILKYLNSDKSDTAKPITMLEKKLTDDLQQIHLKNEQLVKENIEIKDKFMKESNKLKNTSELVKNLTNDTDCLMEKLLKKNNELAELKERVVKLERCNDEIEKSDSEIVDEISSKKEDSINILKSDLVILSNVGEGSEITRLNDIINEKCDEITKYKQIEEEIRLENKRLLQVLDGMTKCESKCEESQTESVSNEVCKDSEIVKLSELIKEQTSSIENYQQTEVVMKKKIEQLQNCLDTLDRKDDSSQQNSSMKETICQKEDKSILKQEEISKLSQIISEMSSEVARLEGTVEEKNNQIIKLKQSEEDKIKDIESLQLQLNDLHGIEKMDCKTVNVSNSRSNEVSDLFKVIEIKSAEIVKYQESEEETKKEIVRLQKCLEDIEKSKKNLAETAIEKCNEQAAQAIVYQEKDDKIAKQEKLIEDQIFKIDGYKKSQDELKNEVAKLQENFYNSSKTVDQYINLIQEKDDQISKLSKMFEDKVSKVEQLIKNEEERSEEITELKQRLESIVKTSVLKNSPIDNDMEAMEVDDVEVGMSDEKVLETDRLNKIIEEKNLEITDYKKSEKQMKEVIEELKKSLNDALKEYQQSLLTQKEKATADDEKEADEVEMRNQIKAYKEEIECLKHTVEASTVKSEEFVTRLALLSEESSENTKLIEELKLLNLDLSNDIDDKARKISSLNDEFDAKMQKMEEKLEVILLERDKFKEKLDSVLSNDSKQNFEKEIENLQIIIDKLKIENESLRKRLDESKILLQLQENTLSVSPVKSSTSALIDSNASDSEKFIKLEKLESSILAVKERDSVKLDEKKFVKPNSIRKEPKESSLALLNTSVSANDKKKSINKSVLESSSIFSNMTYFDDMTLGQSCLQDGSISMLAEFDESCITEGIDTLKSKTTVEQKSDVTLKESVAEVKDEEKSVVNESMVTELDGSCINKNTDTLRSKTIAEQKSDVTLKESVAEVKDEEKSVVNESMVTELDGSCINKNTDTLRSKTIAEQKLDMSLNEFVAKIKDAEKSVVIKSEMARSFSLDALNIDSCTIDELKNKFLILDKENIKLFDDLQSKIQESDEVQKFIFDLKKTLEILQQTIDTLTNDNMNMSKKLTEERENNIQILNDFQNKIDLLTIQLDKISQEKVSLQHDLEMMTEQYENMRSQTPVPHDDDIKYKFLQYQEQLRSLTEENSELSTNLMEKIDELEKFKEGKVQEYDHQCTYREKVDSLMEQNKCLDKENIELSSELTEQIEECDKLKETANELKKQLEAYENQSMLKGSDKNELDIIKGDNERLTNEVIEMRTKIIQLSRENANLSSNLILDNSDEHNASNLSMQKKSSHFSNLPQESSVSDEKSNKMKEKVKFLEEKVEQLTLMNKKLSELKLTNCSRCAQVKELNENRRQLKLELKSMHQKIASLEKDYKQKCIETEALRTKASEDFSASLNLTLMDDSLNTSCFEGSNVTVIEEKVQSLQSKLEELKENRNRLANQCQEKCSEVDKLQIENMDTGDRKDKRSKSEGSSRKTASRIQALQKNLDTLNNEIQDMKMSYANINGTLMKFIAENDESKQTIESLKLANEELQKEYSVSQVNSATYEEKVKLLEEELVGLYKRIEAVTAAEKEMQAQKLDVEVRLESLLNEKSELVSSHQMTEDKFKAEIEDCKSLLRTRDSEIERLKEDLARFEARINQSKGIINMKEMVEEEIDVAKSRIIKEIKTLVNIPKDELKALPKKNISDVFAYFVSVVLSKQTELVRRFQDEYETIKRKLNEEKQQCIDGEKRANVWAKTLEDDLEKIQIDFTQLERKNRMLEDERLNLEHRLKEAHYENAQLHSSVSSLESDLNQLQNEYEKKSKSNEDRDLALSAAQEREKLARIKEEEWENRLLYEKEEYRRKIEKLNDELESYKSLIDDLKNSVEGLELEIEHLKNINNVKTTDLSTAQRRNEELEQVIVQTEDIIQQLKSDHYEKERNNEELKNLLKIKCDLLTEYKTKVETMRPESESLQAQLADRKLFIEKCKEEIHNMKLENKKQLDVIQDKLSNEEIKSAGLLKQIAELKNKNTQLCSTIEEFKDRCAELERENSNLQRKVRNSTSKVRVENEMQELQDENRSLKNHLEGSYNRIKELQESKSQAQRELTEAQGKNDLLEQELGNTKLALESLREKYNNVNLQKLREKYENLHQEKNSVILEIEEKKMLLAAKDQKLVEYGIELDTLRKQKEMLDSEIVSIRSEKVSLDSKISRLVDDIEKSKVQLKANVAEKEELYRLFGDEKLKYSLELENNQRKIDELSKKNKELDEEMDDMVSHVHKLENENAELFDKLITGSSSENLERIKKLEEEKEKLEISLKVAEANRKKLENEIVRLNSEKEQLLSKIEDMNGRYAELESKFFDSRSSSKNNSPSSRQKRGRQKRSDLFNLSRNLEAEMDGKEFTDNESLAANPTPSFIAEECKTCIELRDRIREMSLDVASRNKKITMLEVQLQSENFPYQVKYNELQGHTLALKTRNSELKLEVRKLQRALMEDSSRECQICRQRKMNRRDQGIQAKVVDKICLTGMSSGAVEDYLKITKLEKERNIMKELCRSRAKKVKELEQRLQELEGLNAIRV